MSEIILCRPCAERLKTEKKVTIGGSIPDKSTCAECGKRRFAYNCKTIDPKPTKNNPK